MPTVLLTLLPTVLLASSTIATTTTTCARGDDCFLLQLQDDVGCGDTGFTIHGLWYQEKNGCPGPAFNMTAIEDLVGLMDQLWPTCQSSGSDDQFWGHEWSKHGTCSGLDEHSYFETALDLAQKHRSTCKKGATCLICFDKDLKTLVDCASSMGEEEEEKEEEDATKVMRALRGSE